MRPHEMNTSVSQISSLRITALSLAIRAMASLNTFRAFISDKLVLSAQFVAANVTEGGKLSVASDNSTGQ